jgi:hypothetical protein
MYRSPLPIRAELIELLQPRTVVPIWPEGFVETNVTCHSSRPFPKIQIRILTHLFLMAEVDGGVWCHRANPFLDYLVAQHGEDALVEALVSHADAGGRPRISPTRFVPERTR